jgi:hypothetical protein
LFFREYPKNQPILEMIGMISKNGSLMSSITKNGSSEATLQHRIYTRFIVSKSSLLKKEEAIAKIVCVVVI